MKSQKIRGAGEQKKQKCRNCAPRGETEGKEKERDAEVLVESFWGSRWDGKDENRESTSTLGEFALEVGKAQPKAAPSAAQAGAKHSDRVRVPASQPTGRAPGCKQK